jgi:predicted DNA-binding transcriptional regulator AlpA
MPQSDCTVSQPNWRDLEQIIDIREYGRLTNLSTDTIRRKIARGEGAMPIKLSPRRIGFRLKDVLAVASGKMEAAE